MLVRLCLFVLHIAALRRIKGLNTTVIAVGSVTYAVKTKKQLERMGISASLAKIDTSKTNGSCTHGIKIYSSNLYDAVAILKKMGIDYHVYNDI